MKEWHKFLIVLGVFGAAYCIPFENMAIQKAVLESFLMLQDYARKHVLLCLVPAFFIAGAISVFISQASVMKYLGPLANKFLAYSVASVSGTILAVCSCTVLPLFAGIYRMGAGIGPATAFLYSGPAINILAIVLTAKVLGWQIGLARALGSVGFAYVIGLLMTLIFREDETEKKKIQMAMPAEEPPLSLRRETVYMASMVGVLVFANWAKPQAEEGFWHAVYAVKWYITGAFGLLFAYTFIRWLKAKPVLSIMGVIAVAILAALFPRYPLLSFSAGILFLIYTGKSSSEMTKGWIDATWSFTMLILPLLFGGIMIAGFLLGMPGTNNGIIPNQWIAKLVGGNSWHANLLASVVGAFMYFATLTEVPIIQGLLGSGMGKGPSLALLLAGPALSLPNMIVIRSILGTKKSLVFFGLVVGLSAIVGMIFGWMTGQ